MQHNEEEELAELRKINEKYALDREEKRLNLIEELKAFQGKFRHWGTREFAKHRDRMLAADEAIQFIEAVLCDEEMDIKSRLEMIVFELGYRLKEGRFED